MSLVLKEKEEFVRLERRKHHIKDRRMVWIKEQRNERAEDGVQQIVQCDVKEEDEPVNLVACDLMTLVFQTRIFMLYFVSI